MAEIEKKEANDSVYKINQFGVLVSVKYLFSCWIVIYSF